MKKLKKNFFALLERRKNPQNLSPTTKKLFLNVRLALFFVLRGKNKIVLLCLLKTSS
jgi:hypothetical protein